LLAATFGVGGILDPYDVAAKRIAAGFDLDGATAGIVDPDAGRVGRVGCLCGGSGELGRNGKCDDCNSAHDTILL
jgi:hypothetical protein